MSASVDTIRTQVVIVGGGPAGLAAGRELLAAGIDVVVVDEGQRPGGQIFRQPPAGFRADRRMAKFEAPSHRAGHELIHAVAGIEYVGGATVWEISIERGRVTLCAEVRDGGLKVEAERAVLATGAMDRSLPFPGWTLPGVVTAGAAQVMVRGQMVRPGQRAVVAGTGPLLLPTVTALLSAGVRVVGLFEANRRGGLLKTLPSVLRHRDRRREAWHYARRFSGAGVRMRTGHAVFAAHGDGRVERIVFGKLHRNGRPRFETARSVAADFLCVGYGLLPATELAIRAGCEMHYNELRGGWLPVCDANLRTSVPEVYVAGEIAGIGGAQVSMAEGALAGRAVATELSSGLPRSGSDLYPLREECRAERAAADSLLSAFPVLPGLYDLAQEGTVLCRCEDVTMAQVRQAAALFGSDVRSIKMATRAGMGPCQARICHRIIGDILHQRLHSEEHPTPCHSVQLPVRPVATRTISRTLR